MTLLCTAAALLCALVALAVWGLVVREVRADLHQDDQLGEGGQR